MLFPLLNADEAAYATACGAKGKMYEKDVPWHLVAGTVSPFVGSNIYLN